MFVVFMFPVLYRKGWCACVLVVSESLQLNLPVETVCAAATRTDPDRDPLSSISGQDALVTWPTVLELLELLNDFVFEFDKT